MLDRALEEQILGDNTRNSTHFLLGEAIKNCIDKNLLLSVKNGKNSGLEFWVDSGIYRITQGGHYEIRQYH
ncbi:DUF943 family protein [Rosenbergiella collisarenosi]|uniref:DUF943 family protein n=1 Tax=Rosenbergiella collisarenosi TaxID=1544695 RepID=UPI002AA54CB9